MLDDRTQRQRREEGEGPDDNDSPHQQTNPEGPVRRERAAGRRDLLLRGQAAGDRQGWDDEPETSNQHRQAQEKVVPGCVDADSREGTAVVFRSTRKRVEELAETMRARVVESGDGRS